MQCNIDARGKSIRLILGVITLTFAAAVLALYIAGFLASPLWWIAIAALALGGAFTVFESRSGWCAVRAMGVKTPF